jgi:ribosomal RNA methyltransferase Nop2
LSGGEELLSTKVATLPRESDTEPSSDAEGEKETKKKRSNTKPKAASLAEIDPEEADAEMDEDQIEDDEDETRELELAVEGDVLDEEMDIFQLPTIEERMEEQKGAGASVQVLQRRIQGCTSVLTNFKRLAQQGR